MSGEGAAANPGRWNGPRQRAIYCGGSFAIALLERLCYTGLGRVPKTDVYVRIDVPDHLIERFDAAAHPGWERARSPVARSYGMQWLASRRGVALVVPSAVTRMDANIVLNPDHPGFSALSWSAPEEVVWDARLFR